MIGIGTKTPTAPLTVEGAIESLKGGLKFPDGTAQESAGIDVVQHNTTLVGNGTGASPLGILLPLHLSGNTNAAVVALNNSGSGDGLDAIGGNNGVYGASHVDTGVFGQGPLVGVVGFSDVNGAFGMVGEIGQDVNNGIAVDGENYGTGGYAGYFVGDVGVTGNLSKSGGSFKIDHPLDPANKYLSHSFVESPDMMNIYNGNVITDRAGDATVTLPDWFETLNRDFRYQLTVIGRRNSKRVVKR